MFEIYELKYEDNATLVLKIPKQPRIYSYGSGNVFTGSHKTKEEAQEEIQDKADRGVISHRNRYVIFEFLSAKQQSND